MPRASTAFGREWRLRSGQRDSTLSEIPGFAGTSKRAGLAEGLLLRTDAATALIIDRAPARYNFFGAGVVGRLDLDGRHLE